MTTTNLADLFAEEPPSGAHLAVWADGDPTVIWRDDTGAAQWYGQPEERWFSASNCDPMTFHAILRNATAVQAVVPLNEVLYDLNLASAEANG